MTYPYKYYRYINLPRVPAKSWSRINPNFNLLESYQWHMLEVNAWHDVRNVSTDSVRLSTTGRMF